MIYVGFETLIGIALIAFSLWKTERKDLAILAIGVGGAALAILGRHSCGM